MIPVITCCSVDEVLRASVGAGLLLDLPGAVVVSHDIDHGGGTLRRLIQGAEGIRDDETRPLDHACLGCALREDILPTVRDLAATNPAAIVLALPVTAEPVPVLRALVELADEGIITIGAVISAVATGDLAWDVCGDDLLTERGLALSEDDERALGEVLVRQIEGADVVLLDGTPDALGEALLDHLSPVRTERSPLHEVDAFALLTPRDREDVLHRGDPLTDHRAGADGCVPCREGVWTVTLESWRPFHPERLRENLEILGGRPGRSRGVFWLPTRPHTACQWEGAGGRISLGDLATWQDVGCDACTRMVVTGVEGEAEEVVAAFHASLLTDVELADGFRAWAGEDDGFDPWLGERHQAA
ncbi:GTP-binding protein [Mobilicoccus sp.]|uniref:CobW family GTP-binding protein n=1 Tax=Mobilicoccus sp. TaxID=2034349 RepID=UPI0028A6AA06|nr:GTP-binding protein [Mobilicoccus sp.]